MPKRRGKGVLDTLKGAASAANDFAKSTKIVSKALNAAGYSGLAAGASALGYGAKRSKGGKRKGGKRRGGFSIGSVLGKLTSLPAGLIIGGTAGLQQAISGLGRRGRGNKLQPYLPQATVVM